MAFQVGRIVGLNEPTSWQSSGDSVTVTGSYKALSLLDGLQRRDQILGLANNPDEPAIPVIIDGEARVTGFYRVTGAHVLTDEFVRRQGNLYEYQLQLERVAGFAAPQFESVWSGALMANAFGVVDTTALPFHAVTASVDEIATVFPNAETRESSGDPNGISYWNLQGGGVEPWTGSARWSIAPARYYWSACTLWTGTPLQIVVGRQVIRGDVPNWQLSNGTIRVYPSTTPANIKVAFYTGSAWTADKEFSFNLPGGGGRMSSVTSFTVLRNDPAAVGIRLGMAWTQPSTYQPNTQLFLDIVLRRGAMGIDCYLAGPSGYVNQFWVARTTAEAATAVTGGMYATTADPALGWSYLLASSKAQTNDLVNGVIKSTSAALSAWDVHIGFCIQTGWFAGVQYTATRPQARVYGYFGPLSETVRVVTR